MSLSRGPFSAVAVSVVGACLLAVSACSSSDPDPVSVAEVGRATVVEVVEAPATAVARAAAVVVSPATGTIQSLRVKDGARVRKGQTLLVVDSPATDRALAQAQAAAAAQTSVDLAGLDLSAQTAASQAAADRAFARAREAARSIPDRQLRTQALAQVGRAEAQYQAAVAQSQTLVDQVNRGVASVEQALNSLAQAQQIQVRAAVGAAQAAVKALTVKAPINGTVVVGSAAAASGSGASGLAGVLPGDLAGQAEALLGGSGGAAGGSTTGALEVGSPVSAGDPLLTVTDVSTLSLTAQVDETDVLLVTKGVKAGVEFDAVPGAIYRAVVRNVDLTPVTSSRGGVSYVVRLDLRGGTTAAGEPAPTPRPGMSAVASLRVTVARDVVAVPVSAVFRDGDADAAWLDVDGRARKVPVVVGAQGADDVEILDGVAEGDVVVVSGADLVSEGQELP
ncbi:MAG: HlyD family efflux transporter periplasmic adaptor subunit [Actinomycetota bacterium]|nr:HlyD family efflux transporter periplasmic adaptor subunit [Actinomycetota bacterium]